MPSLALDYMHDFPHFFFSFCYAFFAYFTYYSHMPYFFVIAAELFKTNLKTILLQSCSLTIFNKKLFGKESSVEVADFQRIPLSPGNLPQLNYYL